MTAVDVAETEGIHTYKMAGFPVAELGAVEGIGFARRMPGGIGEVAPAPADGGRP